jgi:hypothetical protein
VSQQSTTRLYLGQVLKLKMTDIGVAMSDANTLEILEV